MVDDTTKRATQAELARHLDVSRAAVHKAIQSGRITPGVDGLFDLEQAAADWSNNTRSAVAASKRTNEPKRLRGGQPKYANARARKEHCMANIAEIKEARLRGELCLVADVVQGAAEVGLLLRTSLEQLPAQVTPQIYRKEEGETLVILEQAIEALLNRVADSVDSMVKRLETTPESVQE